VRFTVDQVFDSDIDAVVRAFGDRALYDQLPELPKLSRPEVLSHDVDGDVVTMQIRYRFDGELSSAARAVLDPSRLSWVERSTHDLAGRHGTFTMDPDHYADRFRCTGSFRYLDDGDGCRRLVEGDLKVRAPLVAGAVERAIVSGLREHLEEQAPAVDDFLRSSSG
jgi:hypothetical protein